MNGSPNSSKGPLHVAVPTMALPKKALLVMMAVGIGLAGCGGEEQSIQDIDNSPGELYFSYPAADQASVPVTAPVFMRFTRALSLDENELSPELLRLESNQGEVIALTDLTMTSGQQGIAARPQQPLKPGTRYTLTNKGLATSMGEITLPGGGISFTTAPATRGPLLGRTEGNGFRVARFIPKGDDAYPATDISVLRIQFTEPVDEQSLRYGDTISLLDANSEPVPAEMYVQGHRVTVDPDGDLDPSQTYTIRLTEGIRSTIADAPLELPPEAPWTFTPLDSTSPKGVRERMAQTATTDTGKLALSGENYNSVSLSSRLLGSNNTTTATGTVFAELGFIPNFENAGQSVPLRIERGALMTGSDVAVNVAGALPAGFSSEAVEVRFLSDANGFLMKNPYTDNESAPRLVELYIDMALNTGNTIANAALGQELLHVHLVGTALVEDGALSIEAVGVIEPDVMGVDVASGLISFRLESYRNPDDAPAESSFSDNEAPTIKSWVPGEDNQDKLRPGDPVIVYFSEPILPGSINSETAILRDATGNQVDLEASLNGSTLLLKPDADLILGEAYTLNFTSGVQDLAGQTLASQTLAFSLPETDTPNPGDQSPLVLTSLPGYPCAKTDADPLNGNQGRCAGGKASDDLLPVTEHGYKSPLIARFSQTINPSTIVPGQTVSIDEYIDDSWQPVDTANYALETEARTLAITPVESWVKGRLYRYTLKSSIDGTGNIIRSSTNLPLQTSILSQSFRPFGNRTFGGPDLVNYFIAGDEQSMVFTPLRNLPTRDANSDLRINDPETGATPDTHGTYHAPDNSAKLEVIAGSVTSDLVTNANIGCPVGQSCQDASFIYKTAMLDVDVSGRVDDSGRVPVNIYPSKLYTTGVNFWVSIDDSPQPICLFLCSAADLVGGVDQLIPTGPMVMRIRYAGPERNAPVPGFIYTHPESGDLYFQTRLDVYLDAPYLYPDIDLTDLDHNMRSFPINGIELDGPITFLDDGRMQIHLSNEKPLNLPISITGNVLGGLGDIFVGSPNTDMILTIPQGELVLNYISPYTQN